jgi:hypothetical protein
MLQLMEAFANASCGGTDVRLSGPGSSGARRLPNGQQQESGGWNRLVPAVCDLSSVVAAMKTAACSFEAFLLSASAASRFNCPIPTGTRSNCSSLLHVWERAGESRGGTP